MKAVVARTLFHARQPSQQKCPHPASEMSCSGRIQLSDAAAAVTAAILAGVTIVPYLMVLEDDFELRSLVTRGLREEGFDVTAAGTASEMFEVVSGRHPDALVIDIGLPDADGRDVVQALRVQGVTAPVIFLTARDALPDRLSGFAAGGDDYLTKPFAFAELVARLHALIKRSNSESRCRRR